MNNMTNYLIDFADEATQTEIDQYLQANECGVSTAYSHLNKVYLVSANVTPPMTGIVTAIIDDDSHAIQLLEVTPIIRPISQGVSSIPVNDPNAWWKVYSVVDIDFGSLTSAIPIFGTNTNVYLLDSGIDITHPEFSGKNVDLVYSFTGEFNDTTGHGTGLGSVIVGNTCGLTNTCLKVIKIFDQTQLTKQSDLLKAFDAVLSDALTSSKFSVVNLSWSVPKNSYIEGKIQHLIDAGFAVVAASGNSGSPISDVTPASMPAVHAIGAYGVNFLPCDFSDYSNTSGVSLTLSTVNSGMLDAWAPGENIYCAVVGGGYTSVAGTSIAAAIYSAGLVYNASQYLLADNSLMTHKRTPIGSSTSASLGFGERNGLLDLSDPKYSSSVNKISSYLQWPVPAKINVIPRLMCRVGGTAMTPMFTSQLVSSFEMKSPLPSYARLEQNFLQISPVDEPVNPNGVDTTELVYSITPLDGSAPFDASLTIVILSSTFDAGALPPDDPLIPITALLYTCVSTQNFDVGCGFAMTSECGGEGGTCCDISAGLKACACLC